MEKKEIQLGDKVKCIYTGYAGIVVTKMIFINKCIQFEVSGKVGKDGKMPECNFIDSQSLVILSRGKEGKEIDAEVRRVKRQAEKDHDLSFKEPRIKSTGGPNHKHIAMRGH